MSNENFDNKIKAKLDSLEPVFQEQDWQNFSPLLHPKKPFWLRFRKPFLFGVATSILFFLIYQNRQLSIENKELHHKVSDIIEKESSIMDNSRIENHEQQKSNIKLIEDANILNNQTISKNSISDIAEKRVNEKVVSKNREIGNTNKHIAENKKVERKQNLDENKPRIALDEKTPKFEVNSQSNKVSPINNQEISSQISATTENNIENKGIETNPIVVETNSQELNGFKKLRDFEILNPIGYQWFVKSLRYNVVLDNPEKVAISPRMIKPSNKFYKFGIGLNTTLRDDVLNGGIVFAYQPKRNIQISSGLEVFNGFEREFKDNGEFKKHFKSDFKDKFPKPFLNDTFFKDIHSRKTGISIPLSINYQFLVLKSLSFFTEIGTNLTLQSKESFDYKFSKNGTNFQHADDRLSVKVRHNIIQNATIAAGLQYNWNRYQFRIAPSYQLEFNKPKFLPKELEGNFGLKFQALYFIH